MSRNINALLVQLVERRFPKPDVVGSSPTGRDYVSTFNINSNKQFDEPL